MSASEIVNKVWNYAHVLRDDGVGYLPASFRSAQARGDYVEQITYLIFLKMADQRAALTPALSQGERGKSQVPTKFNWGHLVKLDGDLSACDAQAGDLELQYRHTLENLGKQGGMLGTIFRKSQNKIQDPAKLERLIRMIDTRSSGLHCRRM